MRPDTRRLLSTLKKGEGILTGVREARASERTIGPATNGSRFVMPVFDEWDTLRTGTDGCAPACAQMPPKGSSSSLLKQMTELHVERSRQNIACIMGQPAEGLPRRLT